MCRTSIYNSLNTQVLLDSIRPSAEFKCKWMTYSYNRFLHMETKLKRQQVISRWTHRALTKYYRSDQSDLGAGEAHDKC